MPIIRSIRSCFNAGELAAELFGFVGLEKLQAGLALCRNFVVLPQGPVQNRAGFGFVAKVKDVSKRTRLIPFAFNHAQTFAVELGAGYFRFHSDGGTLTAVGSAQLLANNEFAASIAGWSDLSGSGAAIAWDSGNGGQLKLTGVSGTVHAIACQAIATVPGQVYMVAAATLDGGGYSPFIWVGSTAGGSDLSFTTSQASFIPARWLNNGFGWLLFTATGTISYVSLVSSRFAGVTHVQGVVCCALNEAVMPWSDTVGSGNSYAYAAGDLASDAAGNVFYALQTVPAGTLLSNTSYWQPMVGPYEVANPYAEGDLFDVHFVQSGDVLSLVHPGYAPMELRRYGDYRWVLADIAFVSSLSAPVIGSAVVSGSGGSPVNQAYAYVVTGLDAYGLEESLASAAVSAVTDLSVAGYAVSVSWSVPGSGPSPAFYNVYKSINGGAFGFVAQCSAAGSLSFKDRNVTPDWTQSPPLNDGLMGQAGDYPGAVGYFEQRRVFAGSLNQPQNFWASQSGTESNMNYSLPSQASDALRVRVAALKASTIVHVVTLWDVLLLTASTVWRVFAGSGGALAPGNVSIKAQSQVGASNTQPVVVNQAAIYAASQGGHVRELAYQWQLQGYQDRDLCLLARHLFDNQQVVELAFSRSPYPVVWAVSDGGKLLGLTYLPDQEVLAWHQHTTQGSFESVCVVQEGNFDVVYVVVNRTIAGVQGRFVERMGTRQYGATLADAFFVDCGATFTSLYSVTSVSGLDWLAGATVSVLLDGKPFTGLSVSSGGVLYLPIGAKTVQVGLAIDAVFETPPLVLAGDGSAGQGRIKNVNKVWARVVDFAGCSVGPSVDSLVAVGPQAYEGDGVTPKLWTGEWRVNIMPAFGPDAGVAFSQPNPLPLTVCDLSMEVVFGG